MERLSWRARALSSEIGRFFSPDPSGAGSGANLYAYCRNSPLKYIDPAGRSPLSASGASLLADDEWGYTAEGWEEFAPNDIMRIMIDLNRAERDKYERPGHAGEYGGKRVVYVSWEKWKDGVYVSDNTEVRVTPGWPPSRPERGTFEYWWKNVYPCLSPTETGDKGSSDEVVAFDPNEKSGPGGGTSRRLIARDSVVPYTVEFENDSTATAPAQIVTITDPLDPNLDWSTLELTEIGFGDIRIVVPENTKHYEAVHPFSYDGTDFEVHIEIGIDQTSGEVYANFYSIDPETYLPPSIGAGFLPPEDGTGRGQGYFKFVIEPREDVDGGTRIPNIAYISFDYQETIATNQIDPHDPGQGTDPEKEAYVTIIPDQVTLTIQSDRGGSVSSPGEGSFIYESDIEVRLTAMHSPGYVFTGWSGDLEAVGDPSSSTTTVRTIWDYTIRANFAPLQDKREDDYKVKEEGRP